MKKRTRYQEESDAQKEVFLPEKKTRGGTQNQNKMDTEYEELQPISSRIVEKKKMMILCNRFIVCLHYYHI